MNGGPGRTGLPARPKQDTGFRSGPANGAAPEMFGGPLGGGGGGGGGSRLQTGGGSQNFGSDGRNAVPPGRGNLDPSSARVLDGYRKDIMNGFQGEKPRYNPMNASHPQSSMLLNVNDPIQVHLLVETALGDSKEFEILSQEEVDDLKKQCQSLSQRIAQTKQNLAIQSKYRDAAISMAKLYSPSDNKKSADGSDGKKSRRSILSHRVSNSDQIREAEMERLASERKCEELANDLWSLEKRLMEPQNRLLKHTAGILQMTHKGPKKMPKGANGVSQSGIPGSPESMYTYSNARSSMEPLIEDNLFDERSFYRSADGLDGYGDLGGRDSFGALPPKALSKEQMQMISKTEQKLEDLNNRLREVIIKANPQREANLSLPPLARTNGEGKPTGAGETLQSHLDYLEKSITAMDQESRRAQGSQSNNQQVETVLMGLWDIIQSGEAEIRQRKQERRQTRSANGMQDDDDESEDDGGDAKEAFSVPAFSSKVQWLFSQATRLKDQKKVLQRQIKQQRELNNKSDATKDAEMAKKVDELERTKALLVRTEIDADNVRGQLSLVMEKLDEARQQDVMREQSRAKDESAAVRSAQEELTKRNETLSALEKELKLLKDEHSASYANIQSNLNDSQSKITSLTTQLSKADEAQAVAEAAVKDKEGQLEEKDRQIEEKEQEMDEMNMEIARLQTEVTIARAELDGAYGTRAQRAAAVASNPAIQKELDDLTKKNASLAAEIATLKSSGAGTGDKDEGDRVTTLKKELEETIEEYEQMTKASIEWEKEREQLEGMIDKLRNERESLETQLSDEKVRWLGMKSPGADGGGPTGASTSTTVLKNEFKKMMRDTRAENAKALRAEQTERRRVEDELRALRKQQGQGKSGLSPRIGS